MKEIKKLTRVEKYNCCPCCGKEVSLFLDDDGDYCFGCMDCLDTNVSTFFLQCPTPDEMEIYRPIWNIQALGDTYSQKVLEQLGIQNGDYLVSDTRDNYIVFAGNAEEMIQFVFAKAQSESEAILDVWQILCGKLFNLGRSILFEITWKHPIEELETKQ